MVNPAGNGVVAYGELDEKARPAANGPLVTEVQLSRCPEDDLHYSWLEDYLAWLEDKEEHQVYYAWLKQAAPWWERSMHVGAGAVLDLGLAPPSRALATHPWVALPNLDAGPNRYRTCQDPSATPALVRAAETIIEGASSWRIPVNASRAQPREKV